MTTIHFERTGGFMGRRLTLTLDLDSLPSPHSATLSGLLLACDFASLPASAPTPPVPDEFIYSITVTTETGQHSIQTHDTALTESLRPLVEELGRLARKR